MALGTAIKYGLPLSFVYCTIYQQNIWREGDEKLVEEQRRVWRDFFGMIDSGYHTTMIKLNLSSEQDLKARGLLVKFDSLDVRSCWNTKVQNVFRSADQIVSQPSIIACKLYRMVQPYISSSDNNINQEKTGTKTKTEQRGAGDDLA